VAKPSWPAQVTEGDVTRRQALVADRRHRDAAGGRAEESLEHAAEQRRLRRPVHTSERRTQREPGRALDLRERARVTSWPGPTNGNSFVCIDATVTLTVLPVPAAQPQPRTGPRSLSHSTLKLVGTTAV